MPAGHPRVLVTGVTGQDGSYLAEKLLAEGCEVHGLVRSPGAARSAGLVEHVGDITDPALFHRLLVEIAPAEVYHLAGQTSVARSWQEPIGTAEATGLAVARLLDAASRALGGASAPRVLVAASAEIFGEPDDVPQSELTPLSPTSPYGAAKAYAQMLARMYRQTGLPVSSVILFNHESPRRPEHFVTRKISRTVAAIRRGAADELVLGNMDVRRDWGWAPDYVDAMVLALRHPVPDDYVIATGVSHSIRDFVHAAFACVGIDDWGHLVRTDPALVRPIDAAELRGDPTRAREVLGWKPTVMFTELVHRMVHAETPDGMGHSAAERPSRQNPREAR
jgi:GDPmannose 4,6-dehydratase